MTDTLSTITTKQQEILKLLYRYRFLDRTHIQALLEHKNKRRIISWLQDLRKKQYVDWHYDATNFIAKSKPAIYYLSLNGIRHLRELGNYPTEELRKRYKEPGRTQVFIDRCLLIADCCIALKAKSDGSLHYTWTLPPDYGHDILDELQPHMYFEKRNGGETIKYLLEIFELTLPRYQLRKRIKEYIEYLVKWDDGDDIVPITLLVCATTADLLYVKRLIRRQIEEYEGDEIVLRVATLDKIRTTGITSTIWEDV